MRSFLLICATFLLCQLLSTQAYPQWYSAFRGPSRRSDQSTVQVCGAEAQRFMHWFCADKTFRLPYKLHLAGVIRIKGMLTDPEEDPYFHKAVKCCRHGCKAHEYTWMCGFHKKLRECTNKLSQKRRGFCHKEVVKVMPWR